MTLLYVDDFYLTPSAFHTLLIPSNQYSTKYMNKCPHEIFFISQDQAWGQSKNVMEVAMSCNPGFK